MQKLLINLVSLNLLLCITFINASTHVQKHVLENGLTVLIRPVKTTQNVSTQLWVNVGSKHEADDEKGLAHWLEHMCFKGTQKMSETDIRLTVNKLSGSFNADTSYDRTRFYLDLPTQHWFEALPILSDIMTNCTFKQDLLNAELQVVIQEMKNCRDDYGIQVSQTLMASVFPDHPYHYPIIGYQSDLESLSREKLVAFYKKHYIPNNAVLVIVGNIDPKEALKQVTKHFGDKKPNFSYKQKQCTHQEDICSKSVTLYRNVQKPVVAIAYEVPGSKKYSSIALDVFLNILCSGQNSRLYKKLVENQKLIHSISANTWRLHDHDILLIGFEPNQQEDVEKIIACIQQELSLLQTEGPTIEEISKVITMFEASFYVMLENNHAQASSIASHYLTTKKEDGVFEYLRHDYAHIKQEIQTFIKKYLRSSVRHMGTLLPLPEEERPIWKELQEKVNQEDLLLSQNKMRQSPVEQGKYVHTVIAQEPIAIAIPKPGVHTLSNGLKVLYYHNDNLPQIEVQLDLKFDSGYQPKDKSPLNALYVAMLFEGTKNWPKELLWNEVEKRGIGIAISPGTYRMSTLNKEAQKAFELLTDIICNPLFEQEKLEKQKQLALTDYVNYWDDPQSIMCYLMGKHLYEEAGFFQDPIGTPESIASITLDDIKAFHTNYCSPNGATIAIAGDLSGINIIEVLEKTLGKWHGPKVEDRKLFNGQVKKTETEITYNIEREQIMLGFIGLSVNSKHKDYIPLLLFDVVFNNKLFALREKTNAFYWIGGSVVQGANQEPGEVFIKTQVSQTRVQEAQELILNTIDTLANEFTQDDLVLAQQTMANDLNDQYSTNGSIVSTFLYLNARKYPHDYLVTRIEEIKKITVQEVRDAVKRVLNRDNLSIFKVGPV